MHLQTLVLLLAQVTPEFYNHALFFIGERYETQQSGTNGHPFTCSSDEAF
jgi:hypothetical protein